MTTPSARNAGLRRLSRVTRLVAVGAVGVTGAFSVLLARSAPGKTTTARPASAQPASQVIVTPTTVDAGLSDDVAQPAPLAPPVAAPRPSQQTPDVVSGGS